MKKLPGAVFLGMLLAFCAGIGSAADDDDKNKSANDKSATRQAKPDKQAAHKAFRQRQKAKHAIHPNRAVINDRRANRANSAGN